MPPHKTKPACKRLWSDYHTGGVDWVRAHSPSMELLKESSNMASEACLTPVNNAQGDTT